MLNGSLSDRSGCLDAGPEGWQDPWMKNPSSTLPEGAISRIILHGKQCIGTAVRLTNSGCLCFPRHAVAFEGKIDLSGITAFDQPVTYLISNPAMDICLVQGRSGECVTVPELSALQRNRPIRMYGYPLAVDEEVTGIAVPVVSAGCISAISPSGIAAVADYKACMPNISGGAVMLSQGQLAGIHVSSVWHRDDRGNRSKRRSAPPPNQMERDPTKVWAEQDTSLVASLPDRAAAVLAADLAPMSLHAAANVQHKDALGLFVPVSNLMTMLQECGKAQFALDNNLKEASVAMATRKRQKTGRRAWQCLRVLCQT